MNLIEYRLNYNLFRRKINKTNDPRIINRKLRLFYCNKYIKLDKPIFDNLKVKYYDFIKYDKYTIYICNICYKNVFKMNKIRYDCGHSVCNHCDKKLFKNMIIDYKCPFCRNIIMTNYNDNYMINNQQLEYIYYIFYIISFSIITIYHFLYFYL